MKKQVITFLFIILCSSSAYSSEIENIVRQLKDGDYTSVQTKLIPLAEQGDARAQYNLGISYMYGNGVPQNNELAFYWTEKSAKQGFSRAEMNLASNYQYGKGTERNFELALAWYDAAMDDPEIATRAYIEAEHLKDYIYSQAPKLTASIASEALTN